MRIDSPDARTRILLKDDGTELARMHRTSWFGNNAELLCDGVIRRFEVGSWRSAIKVTFEGTTVLEITFPWKGGAELKDPLNPTRSISVKQQSIWRSNFEVFDAAGSVIARFRIGMDWSKWRQVVILDAPDSLAATCPPWLLLCAAQAVMVRRSRQAAAAS